MNDIVPTDEYEVEEISSMDSGTLQALQGAEIDSQIATARKFPRSIKAFRNNAMELATLDEKTAMECMYSLPRSGKKITGPSVRLAEIIASAWGNCRFGARVVEEQRDFVVAQGVFHDLEKNSFVSFEVKRRITDKYGNRYNTDMIGVTGNAACSVALRNAVFKGVPKALWQNVYEAAVATAFGQNMPIAQRRANAIEYFTKAGATKEKVFEALGVADEADITLDDLAWLVGLKNGIQEGEYSIDTVFNPGGATPSARRKLDMTSGKVIEPDSVKEDEIPHEHPKEEKKPEPKKAAAKKAAAKPKKEADPEPPPEPEQAELVEEKPEVVDAEIVEEEEDEMPPKPTLVMADALADIPAWVDAFEDYFAALPRTEEDEFMDEISVIQKEIKARDFEQYKRISLAVMSDK